MAPCVYEYKIFLLQFVFLVKSTRNNRAVIDMRHIYLVKILFMSVKVFYDLVSCFLTLGLYIAFI